MVKEVAEKFTRMVVEEAKNLKVGDGMVSDVDMGVMLNITTFGD